MFYKTIYTKGLTDLKKYCSALKPKIFTMRHEIKSVLICSLQSTKCPLRHFYNIKLKFFFEKIPKFSNYFQIIHINCKN